MCSAAIVIVVVIVVVVVVVVIVVVIGVTVIIAVDALLSLLVLVLLTLVGLCLLSWNRYTGAFDREAIRTTEVTVVSDNDVEGNIGISRALPI